MKTNSLNIPKKLNQIINTESIDFLQKAKRKYPLYKALNTLLFSSFLLGSIFSLFYYLNIKPLLENGKILDEISFFSLSFIKLLDDTAIFMGVFFLSALSVFLWGFYQLFKTGYYFVATPTRFIQFSKGGSQIHNWNSFNGSMSIRKNGKHADISLELNRNNTRNIYQGYYVPEKIIMIAINDYIKVINICNKRMIQSKL